MAKVIPILWSAAMARAKLAGLKTQTRRVVKEARPNEAFWGHASWRPVVVGDRIAEWVTIDDEHRFGAGAPRPRHRFGLAGDLLWGRENALPDAPVDGWDGDIEWDGTGRPWYGVPEHYCTGEHVLYQATWDGSPLRWKPSIHMPRWACRLVDRVKSVRVERVESITDDDALAEGIRPFTKDGVVMKYAPAWRHPSGGLEAAPGWDWQDMPRSPREAFLRLFYDVNERAEKGSNPWVWVVEFEPLAVDHATAQRVLSEALAGAAAPAGASCSASGPLADARGSLDPVGDNRFVGPRGGGA